MDDLEYGEYLEYPCRICGSCEYRYYGGGYNCREGHRNDELCEQVADEDDFEFSKSQMRSTQLSMSKMTPQSARVSTRKFRTRSGKGDHDLNARYGITLEEQQRLFDIERERFVRQGEKRKYTMMEVAQQILILQIEAIKSIPSFWKRFSTTSSAGGVAEKKREFEELARKLFQAWANELSFNYSHQDALHPEIVSLSPQPTSKSTSSLKASTTASIITNTNTNTNTNTYNNMDELDRELFLDDYDYGNESSLSDSSFEEEDDEDEYINFGLELEITDKPAEPSTPIDTISEFKSQRFPKESSPGVSQSRSFVNMTYLIHLALLHTGIPILFNDLARGLEDGSLPCFRPDFLVTKDIIMVRLATLELRALQTTFIPSTPQLYRTSRFMLEMLARQCRVPDWILEPSTTEALLVRLLKEFSLPLEFIPYVKVHLNKLIGPLSFVIVDASERNEIIYLTPCALISAAILFFLRLLYNLVSEDDCDFNERDRFNKQLKSQALPCQGDLVKAWHERIQSKRLFSQSEFKPARSDEEFAELLAIAENMLVPTNILDNSASVKGLFPKVEIPPKSPKSFNRLSSDASEWNEPLPPPPPPPSPKPIKKINLPIQNYKHYPAYPVDFNLNQLPAPHRLALKLIECIVGVPPRNIEIIISEVFEKQDAQFLERQRLTKYPKKKTVKRKRKSRNKKISQVESNIYAYY